MRVVQLAILFFGLFCIPPVFGSLTINTFPSYVNLQTCCTSSNGLALLSCANKSSIERFSISDSNIIIVTYATENLFEYFKYSFFVNEAYATRNGYNLVLLDADRSNFVPARPTWNKVKILLDALDVRNGWAKGYEYVMWIDADFIFADFDFQIESLVEMHPTAHIIASAGVHSIINSGSLIVRNSKWARQFLSKWWTTNRGRDTEQSRFDAIFLQEKAMGTTTNTIDSRITILPSSEMNSVAPVWIHHSPESPVLHLHGEMDIYRVAVFSRAKESICSAITRRSEEGALNKSLVRAGETFPRFLNISRLSLLMAMVDVYNSESQSITTHFRQSAIAGNVSLGLSQKLHHMMTKYAQALTMAGRQESKALKRLNFDLLYYSLDHWRALNDLTHKSTGKCLKEWPELLHMTAQAGFAVFDDHSVRERDESIYKVEMILSQLRNVAWPWQKQMVAESFSKLYASKGVIELKKGHPEVAKYNFKLAMDLLRSDVPAISNYTCAALMISIAECYAEQRNKESSMKYIELAISAVNQPLFSGEHAGEYNPKVTIMDPSLRRHEILWSSAATPLKPVVTNGVLRNDHYVRVTALSGLLYVKLQEYHRAKDLLLLSNAILSEQDLMMAGLEPNMKGRIAEGLQIIQAAEKYYTDHDHDHDNENGSVVRR